MVKRPWKISAKTADNTCSSSYICVFKFANTISELSLNFLQTSITLIWHTDILHNVSIYANHQKENPEEALKNVSNFQTNNFISRMNDRVTNSPLTIPQEETDKTTIHRAWALNESRKDSAKRNHDLCATKNSFQKRYFNIRRNRKANAFWKTTKNTNYRKKISDHPGAHTSAHLNRRVIKNSALPLLDA
jgi:hypothetical protein